MKNQNIVREKIRAANRRSIEMAVAGAAAIVAVCASIWAMVRHAPLPTSAIMLLFAFAFYMIALLRAMQAIKLRVQALRLLREDEDHLD